MSISTTIREARERAGISQRRVAVLAGVSNNAVSLWERGDARPTAVNRRALERVLGLDAGSLDRQNDDGGNA